MGTRNKTFLEVIDEYPHENFKLVERRKGSQVVCHESKGRDYFYRYNKCYENPSGTELKIYLKCVYRRKY